MKRILLTVVLIASLVACDKKTEANATNENDTTTSGNVELNAPATPEETSASTEIPKFSSPEIQKVADDYAKFVNEYAEAYKSGDTSKIQNLVSMQAEWATKLQSSMKNMTPEDLKAWTDYMQKLSQKMTDAAMTK